jgi:hypothetical protein
MAVHVKNGLPASNSLDGLFPGDPAMARIPEAEIEQLKRGVPLGKLAEAHGVCSESA